MLFVVHHYNMNKYSYCFGSWYEVDGQAGTRKDSDGPAFPAEYKAVAAVEADDIEEVFEKTNHIDYDWTENNGVVPIGSKHRSTSVGDVIQDSKGRTLLCASSGWKEIG